MRPSAVMDMTPVGMLSRMASVKRRRASSSRLLASSSCGHLVEAAHQAGQLVGGSDVDAVSQVALAHLTGGRQQRRDGTADFARQEQGDPGGDVEDE